MKQTEERAPTQGEILCNYLKDYIPKERTNRIHCHPYSELMVIRQGDVIHTAQGRTRKLEGKSIIYNRAGSIHNQFVQDSHLYERYRLTFDLNDILPTGQEGEQIAQVLCVSFAKEIGDEVFDTVYALCADVFQAKRQSDLAPLEQIRVKSALLLSLLYGISANERRIKEEESYIPAVVKYINAHLDERLTLAGIAADFFVSKSKLVYDFRAYCNMSIHEYIAIERVERAKALLEKGLSVAAVAESLAFSTPSYFIKVFSNVTGTTPLRYQLSRTDLSY